MKKTKIIIKRKPSLRKTWISIAQILKKSGLNWRVHINRDMLEPRMIMDLEIKIW